jgi:hypothetical protein
MPDLGNFAHPLLLKRQRGEDTLRKGVRATTTICVLFYCMSSYA